MHTLNFGGLFCHRQKKILDLVPEKLPILILICWSTDQRKEIILPLSQLSSSSPNISILTRGETKPLCRKYLVLASERRSSSADPDQRSQRTRSLYLSRRRRHERGPPWLGLQMSWQHRYLSNLSKNEKLQYFWILITLILGIQGWNLVESHQTQISFSSSKTEVMQLWN